jgi:hypothetical protein
MKNTLLFTTAILLFCWMGASLPHANAQISDTTRTWVEIKTIDGATFTGWILSETDDRLLLSTHSLIEISLPKSVIRKRKVVGVPIVKEGKYWFENPNATRLFFAPTAIPMRKGEIYYQNFDVAYNAANFGFTDNISMGVAAVPFAWFIEGGFNLAVTPKVGVSVSENFHIGAGLLFAIVPDYYLGIGYGLMTLGNRDNNFSLGLGYGFAKDGEGLAILEFGGMVRVGRRFGLVSENWLAMPEGENLFVFSYGGRYIGERVSVDIGFINQKDIASELPIGIPLAGVVIYFGD